MINEARAQRSSIKNIGKTEAGRGHPNADKAGGRIVPKAHVRNYICTLSYFSTVHVFNTTSVKQQTDLDLSTTLECWRGQL